MVHITPHSCRTQLSLNGRWEFRLDPESILDPARPSTHAFGDSILVPGSWEEQGFGDKASCQFIDTWTKQHEYTGKAWYRLQFYLPSAEPCRYRLTLAGVHWTSAVWMNGQAAGEQDSLSTEHVYDVTPHVLPGEDNLLLIRVDNTIKLPLQGSHIHTRETATNWGGITGGITLESLPEYHLEQLHIYPDYKLRSVALRIRTAGEQVHDGSSVTCSVYDSGQHCIATRQLPLPAEADSLHSMVETDIHLGEDAVLWSDEHPYLYRIVFTLGLPDGRIVDRQEKVFGLRGLESAGTTLTLNGRPVFLRGYVDCCIFPLTGYPLWEKEHYQKQFQIVKAYGFNHVRLHSWTPPQPFWEAADEAGMLVQTELPNWSTVYLNRGQEADPAVHAFYRSELLRILERCQEHPSFVLFSMGNELISAEGHDALNELVALARRTDPSRLYTDNTGFGQLPAHDREGDYFIHSLNWHLPLQRDTVATPDLTADCSAVARLADRPLLAHEHAQYTMYVRPSEKSKYTGVLRPSWLETIEATLDAKGLSGRIDEFIHATGIHLVRTLKESMERVRRTPGVAGIQLLDIRDFPGQGHATTGVLDMFWDSKGIIDASDFRQFNDKTVLLLEIGNRTFYAGEAISAVLKLSHYNGCALRNGQVEWKLSSGSRVVGSGTASVGSLNPGEVKPIAWIETAAPPEGAHALTLEAKFSCGSVEAANEWELWSYPRLTWPEQTRSIWTSAQPLQSSLYGARHESNPQLDAVRLLKSPQPPLVIVEDLTTQALQYVVNGGRLWMMAKAGNQYDEVLTKYMPVFWNYLMFSTQTGTTMGMLVHPHPLLASFPHDGVSNWQWYHLVNHTQALCLDSMPQVEPIIEVIDNFNRAKRLAYAFEARVGQGSLFVSSLALGDAENLKRPETSFMLGEIIRYLTGPAFTPRAEITVGQILGMFRMKSIHE